MFILKRDTQYTEKIPVLCFKPSSINNYSFVYTFMLLAIYTGKTFVCFNFKLSYQKYFFLLMLYIWSINEALETLR